MRLPRGLRSDTESEAESEISNGESTEAGWLSGLASQAVTPASSRVAWGTRHTEPVRRGRHSVGWGGTGQQMLAFPLWPHHCDAGVALSRWMGLRLRGSVPGQGGTLVNKQTMKPIRPTRAQKSSGTASTGVPCGSPTPTRGWLDPHGPQPEHRRYTRFVGRVPGTWPGLEVTRIQWVWRPGGTKVSPGAWERDFYL